MDRAAWKKLASTTRDAKVLQVTKMEDSTSMDTAIIENTTEDTKVEDTTTDSAMIGDRVMEHEKVESIPVVVSTVDRAEVEDAMEDTIMYGPCIEPLLEDITTSPTRHNVKIEGKTINDELFEELEDGTSYIKVELPDGSYKYFSLNFEKTVSQLWEVIEREFAGLNRFQYQLSFKFKQAKIGKERFSSTLASLGFSRFEYIEVVVNNEFDLASAIAESEMLFKTPSTIKIQLRKSDAREANKRRIIIDGDGDDEGSDNRTRIVLIMLDGSKVRMSMHATKTISQLWHEIEARFLDLNRNEYDLVHLHSRKVYSEDSMFSTLVSLNLFPVGVLGFDKKSRDMSIFEKINFQKDQKEIEKILTKRLFVSMQMEEESRAKSQAAVQLIMMNYKKITGNQHNIQLEGIVKQNNPAANYDNGVETRIQLTKLDGSKLRISINDRRTISELWDEIEDKYKDVNREQYCLVQQYPRKCYDKSLSSTLASLCLSPNGYLGFQKTEIDLKEAAEKDDNRLLYEEYHKERMKRLGKDDTRKETAPKEAQASGDLLVTNRPSTLVVEPAVVVKPTPQETKPVENPESTRNKGGKSETRIQLVMLDNSRTKMVTSDKNTLSQLWDEIEGKYKEIDRRSYRLVQSHPRKVFDEECFASTLSFLGLAPSANLRLEKFQRKVVSEEKKEEKGPVVRVQPEVQLAKEEPIIPNKRSEVEARIQLTKLDGSKMKITMSDGKTISQLWDEIEASYKDARRSECRLLQSYPRKVCDENMSSTLRSAGLSPSANLLIELKNVPTKQETPVKVSNASEFPIYFDFQQIAGRVELEVLLPDGTTENFYVHRSSNLRNLWDIIEVRCKGKNISRKDFKLRRKYPYRLIDDKDLNTTLRSLGFLISASIELVER